MVMYDASFVGFYCLDILGIPVTAIPPGGEVHFIDDIRMTVAGTAGGAAVDAAKLGLQCLAVGATGDDEKADFVINTLKKYHVNTSLMQRYHNVSTAASMLNIRPDGSRPALHVRGASEHFTLSEDMQKKAINASVVHFGGSGLLPQFDGEPAVNFMRTAKNHGCITTYDLLAANKGTLALVKPVLPWIDYFMPSIDEVAVMCGNNDVRYCADYFLDAGAKVVAISMGVEGSFIASQDGTRLQIPAYHVEVIDTTGCGDAYSAGFITGIVKNMDLENCARFASACGALVASGLGSDAGIISFEQTLQAMQYLPVKCH